MSEEFTASYSENAVYALRSAMQMARMFDEEFEIKSIEREIAIPLYDAGELVISKEPLRVYSYYMEKELKCIRLIMDLEGTFGVPTMDSSRQNFAERSNSDPFYSVKYLQAEVIEDEDADLATAGMIMETKILMNLKPHPNIRAIYGLNKVGIDAFVLAGRKGFFLITDKITETLIDKIHSWQQKKGYTEGKLDDLQGAESRLTQRLEVAMDIASALLYLHDRKITMFIRPDKIGFDARYGRMKLCDFTGARQEGMEYDDEQTKNSDDMRILAYLPPEIICGANVSCSCDLYSFGIILWEILSLQMPFRTLDRVGHFTEVVGMGKRLPLSAKWPKSLIEIIRKCWDANKRPSMDEVHEVLEGALLFAEGEEGDREEYMQARRRSSKGVGITDTMEKLALEEPELVREASKDSPTGRRKSSSSGREKTPSRDRDPKRSSTPSRRSRSASRSRRSSEKEPTTPGRSSKKKVPSSSSSTGAPKTPKTPKGSKTPSSVRSKSRSRSQSRSRRDGRAVPSMPNLLGDEDNASNASPTKPSRRVSTTSGEHSKEKVKPTQMRRASTSAVGSSSKRQSSSSRSSRGAEDLHESFGTLNTTKTESSKESRRSKESKSSSSIRRKSAKDFNESFSSVGSASKSDSSPGTPSSRRIRVKRVAKDVPHMEPLAEDDNGSGPTAPVDSSSGSSGDKKKQAAKRAEHSNGWDSFDSPPGMKHVMEKQAKELSDKARKEAALRPPKSPKSPGKRKVPLRTTSSEGRLELGVPDSPKSASPKSLTGYLKSSSSTRRSELDISNSPVAQSVGGAEEHARRMKSLKDLTSRSKK